MERYSVVYFTLRFEEENAFDLTMDENIILSYSGDLYKGAYNVKPDFYGTTLETESKFMTDDVTVEPIEVARVSNTSGGTTVYIGGI